MTVVEKVTATNALGFMLAANKPVGERTCMLTPVPGERLRDAE